MANDGKVRIGTELDTSGFKSGLNNIEGSAKSSLGNITSIVSGFSKVALSFVAATAVGISSLSAMSITAYSDYEQLVGGVETLFGTGGQSIEEYAQTVGRTVDEVRGEYDALMTSQETVLNNAAVAYQTAGLSANDYMETVTSFSASLLQGLAGDTQAAAEIANQAVIDMSDNANKMGTDMQLIQNAYQGFAKQNYTMLDNLKLGYGGTQAEMARLINDSGVLGDTMEVTAETVNNVSFDKIIEAIHVIQDEMGIAGTTADEAATTIQGSVNSMKGAWTNLVTGMADEDQNLDVLMDNFVNSVVTVIDNIAPRIEQLLPRIATAIQTVSTALAPYVADAVEALLPVLIQGAISIATSIAASIPEIFSVVTNALIDVFKNALESAPEEVQDKINGLVDLFNALLPVIVGVTAAIVTFRTAMTIASLIQGVSNAINAFKTANDAATISQALLNAVLNANPIVLIITLIAALVAAVITLWVTNEDFRNAVINIFETIISAITAFVSGIVNFFTVTVPNAFNTLVNNAITMKNNAITAFENLKSKIGEIIGNVADTIINGLNVAVDFITSLPGKAIQWGKDFIQGFIDGIASMIDSIVSTVSNIAGTIASYLHFSRPDKGVLREYEKWMPDMMKGLSKGITDNVWRVEKAASGVSGTIANKLKNVGVETNNQAVNYGNNGNEQNRGGNIYIYGDVNDPDVFARKIRLQQRYGLAGAKT